MKPGRHNAITDVPGLLVGHWQRHETGWATGTTVVLVPDGAVGAVDGRGGAPGTRETDLLAPHNLVQQVHAVCLSGGSAYGLAAADGVMRWLAERNHGFPVGLSPHEVVPIVPAAVLFDLPRNEWGNRPTAESGYAACAAAIGGPVAMGTVGAGTGAKLGSLKGGIGTASAVLPAWEDTQGNGPPEPTLGGESNGPFGDRPEATLGGESNGPFGDRPEATLGGEPAGPSSDRPELTAGGESNSLSSDRPEAAPGGGPAGPSSDWPAAPGGESNGPPNDRPEATPGGEPVGLSSDRPELTAGGESNCPSSDRPEAAPGGGPAGLSSDRPELTAGGESNGPSSGRPEPTLGGGATGGGGAVGAMAAGRAGHQVAGSTAAGVGSGGDIVGATVGGGGAGSGGGPATNEPGGAIPVDGPVVGALVAANAVGEAVDPRTGRPWAADLELAGEFGVRWPDRAVDLPLHNSPLNTTIGVIATDVRLDKAQARRLAMAAQDGLVRAVRPAHSMFDGDTVFALATGTRELTGGPAGLDRLCAAAADVFARAMVHALLAAESVPGLAAYREVWPESLSHVGRRRIGP